MPAAFFGVSRNFVVFTPLHHQDRRSGGSGQTDGFRVLPDQRDVPAAGHQNIRMNGACVGPERPRLDIGAFDGFRMKQKKALLKLPISMPSPCFMSMMVSMQTRSPMDTFCTSLMVISGKSRPLTFRYQHDRPARHPHRFQSPS